MIVCVCNRISDRDIVRHVQQGCASFDDLQFELGVATCCGSCTDCARTVFQDARKVAAVCAEVPMTFVPQIAFA